MEIESEGENEERKQETEKRVLTQPKNIVIIDKDITMWEVCNGKYSYPSQKKRGGICVFC